MKKLLTVLIGVLISYNAFGTAQDPDKIIYNGKKYMLHSNPLEFYFDKYPEKRPQSNIVSTGLARGYIAAFEVIDNQLFLKDIQVQIATKGSSKKKYRESWVSKFNDVFPDAAQKMKIDWFTGILVIPYGERKDYVHMGYASTYENYILLEFNNGNLTKEKRYNHEEYKNFKEKQFQVFKQTEKYKEIFDILMNEIENSEEFIDSFLRISNVEYTMIILDE